MFPCQQIATFCLEINNSVVSKLLFNTLFHLNYMINTSINLFEKKNQRHCCEIAVIAIILFYREIGNNKSTVTTEIFYKLDSI